MRPEIRALLERRRRPALQLGEHDGERNRCIGYAAEAGAEKARRRAGETRRERGGMRRTYLSREPGGRSIGPRPLSLGGGGKRERGRSTIVRDSGPEGGPRQKVRHNTQRCTYHGKAREWECRLACRMSDPTGAFCHNRLPKGTHRHGWSHPLTCMLTPPRSPPQLPLHHLHLTPRIEREARSEDIEVEGVRV